MTEGRTGIRLLASPGKLGRCLSRRPHGYGFRRTLTSKRTPFRDPSQGHKRPPSATLSLWVSGCQMTSRMRITLAGLTAAGFSAVPDLDQVTLPSSSPAPSPERRTESVRPVSRAQGLEAGRPAGRSRSRAAWPTKRRTALRTAARLDYASTCASTSLHPRSAREYETDRRRPAEPSSAWSDRLRR